MTAASLDLAAIRSRVEAATLGPWSWGYPLGVYSESVTNDCGESEHICSEVKPRDAEFIAHARTDVPLLLAAVEELLDALEYIACPGKDDADFHADSFASVEAAIAMANRACAVVAKYRSGG